MKFNIHTSKNFMRQACFLTFFGECFLHFWLIPEFLADHQAIIATIQNPYTEAAE
jgi:hypothetical protein